MKYTKYREWKRRMQARQNCIYNAKVRIYIQFNGKDSSDDKSVKIGYPWHRKPGWRQALQSQKMQNLSRYVLYSKTFFALHPRFPHLFGGSFGISVSDRKQQACAAAVQICGAFCFPYTAGGLHIAEKLPFPRCRMDGIFIYSVIERFHRISQN